MDSHEKECALATLALLKERAKKQRKMAEYRSLSKEYREIAATICEDRQFPPTSIPE